MSHFDASCNCGHITIDVHVCDGCQGSADESALLSGGGGHVSVARYFQDCHVRDHDGHRHDYEDGYE